MDITQLAGDDAADNAGATSAGDGATAAAGFSIDVVCWGARWRVNVHGLLDAAGASAMVDIAEVLAARRAPAVDLDLSEAIGVDALGWRSAAYAEGILTASGADCRLISPPARQTHPAQHRRRHVRGREGNKYAA
jgi:hypothetical protein